MYTHSTGETKFAGKQSSLRVIVAIALHQSDCMVHIWFVIIQTYFYYTKEGLAQFLLKLRDNLERVSYLNQIQS